MRKFRVIGLGVGLVIFWVILVLSLSVLAGCKVHEIIKHTHTDSLIVRDKEVPVLIPGTRITEKVNYDSIEALLAKYKSGTKIIYRDDPTNSTRLSFWKDSITGELMERCETLQKEHNAKLQETEHYYKDIIEKEKVKKESWWEEYVRKLFWILVAMLFICFGLRVWDQYFRRK